HAASTEHTESGVPGAPAPVSGSTATDRKPGGQTSAPAAVPGAPGAPTVSITGTSSDVTSVTARFTVDGHGLPVVDCVASVPGGGQAHGNCSQLTVGGLLAGSSTRLTVTARTSAGSGSAATDVTTQQRYGTVACNAAGTPDPTACDNG